MLLKRFLFGEIVFQQRSLHLLWSCDSFRYGFVLCEILTHPTSCRHHSDQEQKLCRQGCLGALHNLSSDTRAVSVAEQCLDLVEANRPSMEGSKKAAVRSEIAHCA